MIADRHLSQQGQSATYGGWIEKNLPLPRGKADFALCSLEEGSRYSLRIPCQIKCICDVELCPWQSMWSCDLAWRLSVRWQFTLWRGWGLRLALWITWCGGPPAVSLNVTMAPRASLASNILSIVTCCVPAVSLGQWCFGGRHCERAMGSWKLA